MCVCLSGWPQADMLGVRTGEKLVAAARHLVGRRWNRRETGSSCGRWSSSFLIKLLVELRMKI